MTAVAQAPRSLQLARDLLDALDRATRLSLMLEEAAIEEANFELALTASKIRGAIEPFKTELEKLLAKP
ncbi:hypothetical protein [Pyrodictium abyssi]|uniref:HEPN domain-containing protein n=1 Tax=Pyrodictium abyssi TaxID=54256 RepID=A0ABM8IVG1_9CREN|nr:hypothetical protein PABY_11080 [Pyrodictium abyssi]